MRLRSVTALLVLMAASAAPALAQRNPIPLNDYTRLGQRFTALQPVVAVIVTVPSWSDNEGGLTLAIWDSPDRKKLLARRVLTGIIDNAGVDIRPQRPLPAGTYYWEISERTGRTRIGLYCDTLTVPTDECAYFDGKPNPTQRFLFEVASGPQHREKLTRLIAILQSPSTPQQKSDACRQLAVFGTPEAVPALAKLLGDPQLSHMARYAMENMPGKTVDAAFRAALRALKGPQLVGVINSVAVRRDAVAVPQLAALMKSGQPDVADAATIALGRIGTPACARQLLSALAKPLRQLRPAVYEAALQCAELLSADTGAKPALTPASRKNARSAAIALYGRLWYPDAPRAVRIAAMRGMVLARGADGLPMLLRCLHFRRPDVLNTALSMVQHDLPGKRVTLALAAELAKLPASTQALLLGALARRHDLAALPALEAAATNGAKETRLAAIAALPALGADAAGVLVAVLEGSDHELAEAARAAAAQLPTREVTAMVSRLLGIPMSFARLAGVELAWHLQLRTLASRVAATLGDPEVEVRREAAQALAEIGAIEQVPALCGALLKARSQPEADGVEQALAAVCGRAANPEAVAAQLADAATAAPPARRAALYRLLGGIGGARALAVIRDAAAGPSAEGRSAAIDVLSAWPTDAAASDLLRLARDAADQADRIKALRGVLRMAANPDCPAARRLQLCRDSSPLTTRSEEKRLMLSALGTVPSADALDLVLPYLEVPEVKEEACSAALAIAEKLLSAQAAPKLVRVLRLVARAAQGSELADRAQAFLKRAEALAPG